MGFSLFINFDGDCRQAVDFYARVFDSEVQGLMTFAQVPDGPEQPANEADRNRIMYSAVPIGGVTLMFSDAPSGMPLVKGTNISPVVTSTDKDEMHRRFAALSEGGTVVMALQETFWSELFGMVTDRFGVTWQLSHESGKTF